MIKILLDIASNGVIKTVTDNNINGAGDIFERKSVYNFEDDESFEKRMHFLYELCEELGIETGNKYDKDTVAGIIETSQLNMTSMYYHLFVYLASAITLIAFTLNLMANPNANAMQALYVVGALFVVFFISQNYAI